MPRSVNAVAARAKRKKFMKMAKGYFGRRKNVWTVAKNAIEKGLVYAYRDRRQNKRNFRSLWIQRIGAGARVDRDSISYLFKKAFPFIWKRLFLLAELSHFIITN